MGRSRQSASTVCCKLRPLHSLYTSPDIATSSFKGSNLDVCVIHLKAWVLLGAGQVMGEQGGSCSHQVVQQCGHDGGFAVVHMTLHHD